MCAFKKDVRREVGLERRVAVDICRGWVNRLAAATSEIDTYERPFVENSSYGLHATSHSTKFNGKNSRHVQGLFV